MTREEHIVQASNEYKLLCDKVKELDRLIGQAQKERWERRNEVERLVRELCNDARTTGDKLLELIDEEANPGINEAEQNRAMYSREATVRSELIKRMLEGWSRMVGTNLTPSIL